MEAQTAAVTGPRSSLDRFAEWFAAAGGFSLLGVMAVEVVSIAGGLLGKPILGDSEIVEMLCGIAIMCFLPYCQLRGGNVIVDFFTMKTSQRTRDGLDALMHVIVALVVAVVTWRLIDGAFTQYERERVSMFLRLPQWWGYGLASIAAALWVVACFATAGQKIRAAVTPADKS
ncbi:MAG: TRAP transporter small permease [Burkholderiales bacterium]